MHAAQNIAVVVVAGGKGERATSASLGLPKQYVHIAGKPLLAHTLDALLSHPQISIIQPVIGDAHTELFANLNISDPRIAPPVVGGSTRQASVLAGLRALQALSPDLVLIHDGARPFISNAVIDGIINELQHSAGALPATRVTDTIKRSADGKTVFTTEDRNQLFAAQTPQGFSFPLILAAHEKATSFSDQFTDDASIAEWAGITVALTKGDIANIKITLPEDFLRAERLIAGEHLMETRVGTGYDVHAFEAGNAVILGNIAIPHTAKLKGHSDADVVLHALSDAIYGALADGDIGKHFPPSDMKWHQADSKIFLEHAANLARSRGGRIVHMDTTIICEFPKIGPHVEVMRNRIALIAGISPNRVAVKATTSEKLGFIGREEGIAAYATVTLEMPRQADE